MTTESIKPVADRLAGDRLNFIALNVWEIKESYQARKTPVVVIARGVLLPGAFPGPWIFNFKLYDLTLEFQRQFGGES